MGNYLTTEEFNAYRRKVRDYDSQYTGSNDTWNWDSSENRETFKDLRIRSDRDKNRMVYAIGAMALNRILSAIEAGRGMASVQKKYNEGATVSVGFDSNSETPLMGVSYTFNLR
jgi:hypothetical protein